MESGLQFKESKGFGQHRLKVCCNGIKRQLLSCCVLGSGVWMSGTTCVLAGLRSCPIKLWLQPELRGAISFYSILPLSTNQEALYIPSPSRKRENPPEHLQQRTCGKWVRFYFKKFHWAGKCQFCGGVHSPPRKNTVLKYINYVKSGY